MPQQVIDTTANLAEQVEETSLDDDLVTQVSTEENTLVDVDVVDIVPLTVSEPKDAIQVEQHMATNNPSLDPGVNSSQEELTRTVSEEQTPLKNSQLDVAIQIPSRLPWQKEEEIKKVVIKYHNAYAKIPTDDIKKAKAQHEIYMKQLEMTLRKEKWCKKLEYTGSSYEGLKTSDDGLEFDVMFIMDGMDLYLTPIKSREGYSNVQLKDGADRNHYEKFINSSGVLAPKLMVSKFNGIVQKCLNELKLEKKIKPKLHGPAVQIDVYKDDMQKSFWFSVDLVPSFEIRSEEGKLVRYVPKPINEPDMDDANLENSWRRSFSKEEKDLLQGLDRGSKCQKQVARILKALCRRDTTLKELTSYHIKTILFHTVYKTDLSWTAADLADRVFDMLGILEYYLTKKWLSQYFVASMNLLGNIKDAQMYNMQNRVKGIRTSETKFKKAFA